MNVEKTDLDELVELLNLVARNADLLVDGNGGAGKLSDIRFALQSFRTTAAMLGMPEAECVGIALEEYLAGKIAPVDPPDIETIIPFAFAIDTLREEMRGMADGGGVLNAARITQILLPPEAPPAPPETAGDLSSDELPAASLAEPSAGGLEHAPPVPFPTPVEGAPMDFSVLRRITESMGGELALGGGNGAGEVFQLTFPASRLNLERLQRLLSPCDLQSLFAEQLGGGQDKGRMEKVLNILQEFMLAFSAGEVRRSQEILLLLAEQQQQAGLYRQVGVLARQLHDSIKNFVETLDPALVDIVEAKLPDSGSRLEHILKLTEHAANTTLDHVEIMQKRNQEQQTGLEKIEGAIASLRAVGEKAQQQLEQTRALIGTLRESTAQTSGDLITILTAQDYQDLTGQVILKIMDLLKDLESKLVNVIRTFGVRLEGQKLEEENQDLYGPAHEGKVDAVHSQDDVDQLLSEFGF